MRQHPARSPLAMKRALAAVVLLVILALVALWVVSSRDRQSGEAPGRLTPTVADETQRGRELVELADCRSCHTARGGALFAGGREIPTPFGTFYSPNITPDARTGLGSWSAEDFWHALH